MKSNKLLLTVIFFTFSFFFQLYPQRVTYAYDAAGNRISRTITLPRNNAKGIPQKEEPEPYSDFLNDKQVKIYPNPTKGQLSVDIPGGGDELIVIQLVDVQGKVIYNKTVSSGRTDLNLTDQPEGTYLMKIFIGTESTTWKIIKE